jgi:hypothetical protein
VTSPSAKTQIKTQVAKTKPQTSPVYRTAAAQPIPAKPQETVAEAAPQLRLRQTDKNDTPRSSDPQMRTAYTAPAPSGNSTLSGAQPVVPAGSFDSRWSGFR